MNKPYLLSVLTPVYNGADYLVTCLKNVIDQRCDQVEHIIVDGGSKDGTLEVLKKYTGQYSHIRFLSEKDRGQSDAMNKAIELSTAPFISFLNVDDYYEEGALLRMVQLIKENDKLDFAVGNCLVWDNDLTLIYENKPKQISKFNLLRDHQLAVNPCAYFYKKKLHEKLGGYDVENHYNMDIDWLIRVAFHTDFKYYNEVWGNFVMHEGAKTYEDAGQGLMQERKHRLYQKYIHQLSFFDRLTFESIQVFDKRKFRKIRRKTWDKLVDKLRCEWHKLKTESTN